MPWYEFVAIVLQHARVEHLGVRPNPIAIKIGEFSLLKAPRDFDCSITAKIIKNYRINPAAGNIIHEFTHGLIITLTIVYRFIQINGGAIVTKKVVDGMLLERLVRWIA